MNFFIAFVFYSFSIVALRRQTVRGSITPSTTSHPAETTDVTGYGNQTEEHEDLQHSLNEIKGQLTTIINALENRDYCPQPLTYPVDCYEVKESGETVSGVYTIKPEGMRPFEVYCDMDTDGGGWTVFQRRQDGSVHFFRNWNDYANGFGSVQGEHWLGNDKLHALTNQKTYGLRVDLADFYDSRRFAKYNSFVVGNSFDNYRLRIGPYSSGNAGNALEVCDSQQFSTRDVENDQSPNDHCANRYKGGWWYNSCHAANLNGLYLGGSHRSYADGVVWKPWRGFHYSLKLTEMKLRPV